jgi:glycopeptide antibiotics resistance protein
MEACRPGKLKIAITICYMLLLVASSAIPMDRPIKGLQFIMDLKPTIQNLLHIPMFAVLSILYLQILINYQFEGWKRNSYVLLLSLCFGIINEAIQIVIPGRYGGITDIVLNLIGAFVGILIYSLVEKSRPGVIRRIICD